MRSKLYKGVLAFGCLPFAFFFEGCGGEEILSENVRMVALDRAPQVAEKSFLQDSKYHFAYDSLSEDEQIWYRDIAESLGSMATDTRLSKEGLEASLDEEDIDRIFQCVLIDHPEIFYVDGYTYTKYNRGDTIISIEFTGTFSMDFEEAEYRQNEIEVAVEPILENAREIVDDYEKIKYVYETIIYNMDYNPDSEDNQNIYSVFVNRRSVCQGYAKAVQYLLNCMGVECVLVQGNVNTGEGHAWNLVKSNGSYYYVDATWGDASYQPDMENEDDGAHIPDINYDYLCVTTKQILETHRISSCVAMPACVDTRDNYYVREDAVFYDYDKEQMKKIFEQAEEDGRMEVTFKCSSIECFNEILAALVDGQEIFGYLTEADESVFYIHNEKLLSMTFWVTNG